MRKGFDLNRNALGAVILGVLLFFLAFGLLGNIIACNDTINEITDAQAKQQGYCHRIDYEMYAVPPEAAKEKWTLERLRHNENTQGLYGFAIYVKNYKISDNKLIIQSGSLRAHRPGNDRAFLVFRVKENETWKFGWWTTTKTKTWNAQRKIIEKEQRHYFAMYSVKPL